MSAMRDNGTYDECPPFGSTELEDHGPLRPLRLLFGSRLQATFHLTQFVQMVAPRSGYVQRFLRALQCSQGPLGALPIYVELLVRGRQMRGLT